MVYKIEEGIFPVRQSSIFTQFDHENGHVVVLGHYECSKEVARFMWKKQAIRLIDAITESLGEDVIDIGDIIARLEAQEGEFWLLGIPYKEAVEMLDKVTHDDGNV